MAFIMSGVGRRVSYCIAEVVLWSSMLHLLWVFWRNVRIACILGVG